MEANDKGRADLLKKKFFRLNITSTLVKVLLERGIEQWNLLNRVK